jgi:hypothetical protein
MNWISIYSQAKKKKNKRLQPGKLLLLDYHSVLLARYTKAMHTSCADKLLSTTPLEHSNYHYFGVF